MSHPSEGELLALADGALDDAGRRRVQVHVQGCAGCRQALRELEQAMRSVTVELALVDAGEPAAWRSGDATPVALPRDDAPRTRDGAPRRWEPSRAAGPFSRRRSPSATRWAALLLVLVASGATAMIAPRWSAWRTPAAATEASAASAAAPASVPVLAATTAAAVSILPDGGRVMVALSAGAQATGDQTPRGLPAAGDGRVRVRLSDRLDAQVTVTTTAGAATAPRFASADGRLDVQLPARATEVLVELPATLRSARITYDGRTIVTVSAGEVQPAQATAGGVVLAPATHP
jgi:hypothetical protein